MKRAACLFLLAGLAVTAILIARAETGDILLAFRAIGLGGFALILAVHLALIGVMGSAWAALADPPRLPFLAARLLRDSAAEVLPLSQIGGFVLGARALVLAGILSSVAAATTVVDVTTELVAQLGYTMAGVALLVWERPGSAMAVPALTALAAMAALVVLFAVVQRGAGPWIDRLLARAARGMMGATGPGLGDAIRALHARRDRLAAGTLLHLLAWLLVGCETWLILNLAGARLGLAAALVIDCLISGLRSMAFMVPQALGVQEGGYIMLGALFGLSAEQALALSLLRRARDIAIGVPVLLVWQIVEGRRLARR